MSSFVSRLFAFLLLVTAAGAQDAGPEPDVPAAKTPASDAPAAESEHPPVQTWLEAQVELHRCGFSCGAIDGVCGPQTVGALRAFQRSRGIAENGDLDQPTRDCLRLTAPVFTTHTFTDEELAQLHPVPETWLGKSAVPALAYATALEMVAEHYRASPNFVRQNNPDVDWTAVSPGTMVKVPGVERATITGKAAQLTINLSAHELEAVDEVGRVIAHFPVSIARMVEKRPVGELHVKVVIPDPNYTFDPDVFPESAEARELGRKLVIPPGPNNPVGLAWIGLDVSGYGIHGTPDPEKVGRTESHGCFRLANWDAVTLLGVAKVGMTVLVTP